MGVYSGCCNINFNGYFSFIMKIGSIKEKLELEQRIAVTPEIIKKYKSLDLNIILPKGYGEHLGISDKEFINWEPSIDLKSGLEKTYNWIHNQIKSGENTLKFTKS